VDFPPFSPLIKLNRSSPNANPSGTTIAIRNDPLSVETNPIIHGNSAAPNPDTAKINPASRAVGRRFISSANVVGKNGAKLSPSSTQYNESSGPCRVVTSAAIRSAESPNPILCIVASRITRNAADETARPTVSADHNSTIADCPPINRTSENRSVYVVSQPVMQVSSPPYKNSSTANRTNTLTGRASASLIKGSPCLASPREGFKNPPSPTNKNIPANVSNGPRR